MVTPRLGFIVVAVVFGVIAGSQAVSVAECKAKCKLFSEGLARGFPEFQKNILEDCLKTCGGIEVSTPEPSEATTAAPSGESNTKPVITLAKCKASCKIQAEGSNDSGLRARILDVCIKTCDVTSKPGEVTTAAPGGGNSNTGTTLNPDDVSGAVLLCEKKCEDQERHLKANPNYDKSFLASVLVGCKRSCVNSKTLPVDSPCEKWVDNLLRPYMREKDQASLDLLKMRAKQACD